MSTTEILAFLREQLAMYERMRLSSYRGEKVYVTGQRDAIRYAIKHIEERSHGT